jgi:hypothetical protein
MCWPGSPFTNGIVSSHGFEKLAFLAEDTLIASSTCESKILKFFLPKMLF